MCAHATGAVGLRPDETSRRHILKFQTYGGITYPVVLRHLELGGVLHWRRFHVFKDLLGGHGGGVARKQDNILSHKGKSCSENQDEFVYKIRAGGSLDNLTRFVHVCIRVLHLNGAPGSPSYRSRAIDHGLVRIGQFVDQFAPPDVGPLLCATRRNSSGS